MVVTAAVVTAPILCDRFVYCLDFVIYFFVPSLVL